jgi:hypothetical protein
MHSRRKPAIRITLRTTAAPLLALALLSGCAGVEGERPGLRQRMADWREAMRPRFGPVESYGMDSRAREIEQNLGAGGNLRQAW